MRCPQFELDFVSSLIQLVLQFIQCLEKSSILDQLLRILDLRDSFLYELDQNNAVLNI